MLQIRNKHLKTTIDIDRMVGQYEGNAGPLFLIFGGIHGNEASGILAMYSIFNKLRAGNIPIRGKIAGIAGNLCALAENVRYCDENLNRAFLEEKVAKTATAAQLNAEEQELKAITDQVKQLTADAEEVFFIDCHSTSAESEPFISLNTGYPGSYDFVDGLPVNTVVGLEKELEGCLSEYYNKQGFHGFTFEGGQHEAVSTIRNHKAVIWLLLVKAGILDPQDAVEEISQAKKTLSANVAEGYKYFSVTTSYIIDEGEQFVMEPSFVNLQTVIKGQLLAHSNERPIYAPCDGRILMPLYQKQGRHGYFFVNEISNPQSVKHHEAINKEQRASNN